MSSSDSDRENIVMTPPELKETAQAVVENLLPEKSRNRYNKAEKAQKYKPSSLWSLYSMLKSTLLVRNNVNIIEYKKVTSFLKRKSEGSHSRKSKVLTTKDVYSFLQNAPDDKYLLMKVILILGINGACRSQELLDITTDDIEIHENIIIV